MKKLLLCMSAMFTGLMFAQNFTINNFATGLNEPVDVAMAPGDNRFYVVERAGRIRIVNTDGSLAPGYFMDISARVFDNNNEQGLLGLAFDPDYQNNGYFYVNYIIDSAGTSVDEDTRIARFSRSTSNPDQGDPNSEYVLMRVVQPYWNHNGGCVRFGPDGYLYLGLGDGGSGNDPGNRAQNPTNRLGKIMRISVDGGVYGIPATNPFYGNADTLPEIWTLGVRNPWKFNFDKLTGDMWIGDVGQDAYEEVDHQLAGDPGGDNYGWRCWEGLHDNPSTPNCTPVNYVAPVAEIPQSTGPACSVTGGVVYRGGLWGAIYGKYIFTDFCYDYFWQITYDTTGAGSYLTERKNQVPSATKYFSNFVEDNSGNLYVCELYDGAIYRITLDNCTPAAYIENAWNAPVSICSGSGVTLTTPPAQGLNYQWLLNGSPIAGANDSVYTATASGDYQVIVTNPSCGTNPTDTSLVLTINPGTLPVVSLTAAADTVCETTTSFALTGTPAGGTFTSPFVDAGGVFQPSNAGIGIHQIVYSYTNTQGCSASDTLEIRVVDCTAGVEDEAYWGKVSVYPNPTSAQISFDFYAEGNQQIEIMVNAMDGKVMEYRLVQTLQGKNKQVFDFTGWTPGMYMVRLQDGVHTLARKIVVQ